MPARDCDLLRCERFASDRGVSISCSARNVTVMLKSDCWNHVVRALAEADVQFGHFPSGKAALEIATPRHLCPMAAPIDF